MNRILFCNVTMQSQAEKTVYTSADRSVPAAATPVVYPVSAFLEASLAPGDHIKAVLLVKNDSFGRSSQNARLCRAELAAACAGCGAEISFETVSTDFAQDRETHSALLGRLVEQMEEGAHILADITYGPKDLPIVLFTALNFAERFLGCEIDNILYGQAEFQEGKPVNTRLCDMIPLYSLNTLANTVRCKSAAEAKEMLKLLLAL